MAIAVALTPIVARADGDVPKSDPSYAEIQDLANKGYVGGYDSGQDLFQGRTLNRYEMAALVKRAIDTVTALQNGSGAKPSAADLSELNALVSEFAVELDIMGAHVSTPFAPSQIATSPSAPAPQPTTAPITPQTPPSTRLGVPGSEVPTTSLASLRISGLFQEWYLSGSRDVTNFGSGPGVGTGLTSPASDSTLASTFKIRRAQIRFLGDINKQTYFDVMIDPSKDQNISISTTPSVISTAATSPLQDMILGYHVAKSVAVEVGQQKVPISIEGLRPNAALLTVERSLMNSVPVANGRVGDIRDVGLLVRYNPTPKFGGIVAVMDDAGNSQNLPDDNNSRELFLNGQLHPLGSLQVGGWGETSGGVGTSYTQRRRIGGDFDYVSGGTELTGEYEEGYDGGGSGNDVIGPVGTVVKTAGTDSPAGTVTRLRTQGAYLTYAYSVSRFWQFVARQDYFNPDRDRMGSLANAEDDSLLGVNYYIRGNYAKIQLNFINRAIHGPLVTTAGATYGAALCEPTLGASRYVFVTNFQQAF